MTIDGVDILTIYGLRLLKVEDFHQLPERKKTTAFDGTADKDIVHGSRKITLSLKGSYSSPALVISQLKAFETLLKDPLIHEIDIPEHGINVFATATDGFQVKPYLRFNAAIVTLTMTIVE